MSHDVVDQLMEQSRAGTLRSPVSETLQMRLVDFGRGEATYEMPARAELGNPLGVIQGGVATALADAAMAAATTTILSDEEIQREAITTVDLFARFLRPVNPGQRQRGLARARGGGGGGGWCGQVAGWSGRRPRSSRTATASAGSRRPESVWPLTHRPTSRGTGTGTGT